MGMEFHTNIKVYTLEEACNWFLNNSRGSIICIKDTEEIECNSYPKAEKFYQEKDKQCLKSH